MIICDCLTKRFGPITAIQDFSVEIPDGRIFGLLGPNGAGKTTTMRMLSCLIQPTSGKAMIDEYDITKKQDAQKIRCMIGFLPEVPGLYETLGAYKNLDYYAQLYGIPKQKREQAIKETLTNLELWDRRANKPRANSLGLPIFTTLFLTSATVSQIRSASVRLCVLMKIVSPCAFSSRI